MTAAQSFWDRTARKYAASPIRDIESYEYTLGRTQSYLEKTHHALEIGCGTGSTAMLLAPSVAHLTAADISGEMINIAREKADEEGIDNLSFEVADVEGSGREPPYDVVMAHNLLHLVPEIEAAMSHIASVCKPGGLFISKTVVRPSGFSLSMAGITVMIKIMQLFGKAPFVRFDTVEETERRIAGAGFRVIETWEQKGTLRSRYVVARKL